MRYDSAQIPEPASELSESDSSDSDSPTVPRVDTGRSGHNGRRRNEVTRGSVPSPRTSLAERPSSFSSLNERERLHLPPITSSSGSPPSANSSEAPGQGGNRSRTMATFDGDRLTSNPRNSHRLSAVPETALSASTGIRSQNLAHDTRLPQPRRSASSSSHNRTSASRSLNTLNFVVNQMLHVRSGLTAGATLSSSRPLSGLQTVPEASTASQESLEPFGPTASFEDPYGMASVFANIDFRAPTVSTPSDEPEPVHPPRRRPWSFIDSVPHRATTDVTTGPPQLPSPIFDPPSASVITPTASSSEASDPGRRRLSFYGIRRLSEFGNFGDGPAHHHGVEEGRSSERPL